MKIALDVMGGDHAPGEIVAGAVQAAREYGIEVILSGPERAIRDELARHHDVKGLALHLLDADEIIGFDEQPVQAIKKKKNSSLVKGLLAVREKQADALVSAGSTGALLAGGLLVLGRQKGIERPALATLLPTRNGMTLILDVGATTDCTPENLVQFAFMGSLYSEIVLKVKNPRVGLLNIGIEEVKGNHLTKATYPLLQESGLNFIGNSEARDAFQGRADVIICDGFCGNVLLKSAEGVGLTILDLLKAELTRSPLTKAAALILKPGLKQILKRMDYSEYGGAPFLGVEGALIKCHGSSRALAIKNGIRVAAEFVVQGCLSRITEKLAKREATSQ